MNRPFNKVYGAPHCAEPGMRLPAYELHRSGQTPDVGFRLVSERMMRDVRGGAHCDPAQRAGSAAGGLQDMGSSDDDFLGFRLVREDVTPLMALRGRGHGFPFPKDGSARLEAEPVHKLTGLGFRLVVDAVNRADRGSDWQSDSHSARRVLRGEGKSTERDTHIGFRLARGEE